jgi:predicted dehydrogenase
MGPARPLGFGVVGINSRVRRAILTGLRQSSRARLVAVCSRDPAKAAATAADFDCTGYASYPALLADPAVDVVVVCTPHAQHHPMTMAALAAGKQVVCEKPLACTVADAEAMLAAAERSGRPSLVNFTYHSLAGHRLVARLLQAGAIGAVRYLDLAYWQARLALPDAPLGDALLDVGSHQIDLAQWWLDAGDGGAIVAVTGQVQRLPNGTIPTWAGLARTDRGALVTFQANRRAAGWRNGMECRLIGETGCLYLRFDTDAVAVELARLGDGSAEGVARPVPIPDDLQVSYRGFPAFQVDRWVAALRGEGDFPTFADGVRCQRVIAAVQAAEREPGWVTVGAGPGSA